MLEPLNTFLLSNNTHKRLILELSQSWNIIKLNVCTMHGNELNWNASSVHFCCFVNSFKRSCHKPAQSINQSNVLSQWDQSSTGNTQTCKHSNTKLIKSIDKKRILNKNVIVNPCSRLSTARRPYLCNILWIQANWFKQPHAHKKPICDLDLDGWRRYKTTKLSSLPQG